jgi:hypothetical protein
VLDRIERCCRRQPRWKRAQVSGNQRIFGGATTIATTDPTTKNTLAA